METPVIAVPVTCDCFPYYEYFTKYTGPCWLDFLKFFTSVIILILYFFLGTVLCIVAWILSLLFISPFVLMIYIGYYVAFILHIVSFGLLFRFEEFYDYSCCLRCCGLTVDQGGLEGLGFPSRRSALEILFDNWILDFFNFFQEVGGGGGGGGGGDGGGGNGG